eukprot:356938-Chlamydomonas_euryale.AAC.1
MAVVEGSPNRGRMAVVEGSPNRGRMAVVEGSPNRGRMALFHQQRDVAVALGQNGREVNRFVLNMPRSAYGHGSLLSVEPIAASFVVFRRSDGDIDGRRHGPHERRRALVTCRFALVARLSGAWRSPAAGMLQPYPRCQPVCQLREVGRVATPTRQWELGGERPPPPRLSMARLALGMKGGRPKRVSSVRWNSVAPFLV